MIERFPPLPNRDGLPQCVMPMTKFPELVCVYESTFFVRYRPGTASAGKYVCTQHLGKALKELAKGSNCTEANPFLVEVMVLR